MSGTVQPAAVATMPPEGDAGYGVRRFADFDAFQRSAYVAAWPQRHGAEALLLALHREAGALPGYCTCCGLQTRFTFTPPADPNALPNWREELECEHCHLIARWRLCVTEFLRRARARPQPAVYLTEQASRLFAWIKRRYPAAIGSEFVSSGTVREAQRVYLDHLLGTTDAAIRHEDVTRLTLADASQDFVLSFDVLEHVPDYAAALREFARVLKPGATLVLSVPLVSGFARSVQRARLGADGTVEHLLEPEYHGDPASDAGCLAYYNFGWDLLDAVRAAGFAEVELLESWCPAYGVLGGCNAIGARR